MTNLNVLSGFVGAFVMGLLGAVPFLVGWGRLHSEIEGLKARLDLIERDLGKIDEIRADVSYIRGILDGENRPHRKPVAHHP